jgi:hypothetical protein
MVPSPRFTATSAPMPLAQKPSILPSSIAFAALTPNDTPAGLAGIGGGAICNVIRAWDRRRTPSGVRSGQCQ